MLITEAAGCHDRERHAPQHETDLTDDRAHNDQRKAVPAADRQRQDNRYSHATPTMDCNPIAPFGAKTAVLATIAGGIVMRGFSGPRVSDVSSSATI